MAERPLGLAGAPEHFIAQRLREDQLAFALVLRMVRSPEIARLLRGAGYDAAYLDIQHGLFDPESLVAIIHSCLGAGIAPLVRVSSAWDPQILRVLDAGATGIITPDIGDADEARAAVAAVRHRPLGRRSHTSASPHTDYRRLDSEKSDGAPGDSEADPLLICMIESVRGLDNLDAIASVEGVSGLYVGTNDLGHELDRPPNALLPELEQVARVAREHGLFLGCGGLADPADQAAAIDVGVRLLTVATDVGLLASGAATALHEVRTRLEERSPD